MPEKGKEVISIWVALVGVIIILLFMVGVTPFSTKQPEARERVTDEGISLHDVWAEYKQKGWQRR